MDLQVTYKLNDSMSFDFSGVNLTNEMQQQYYKFGDAGSPELDQLRYGADRTLVLGRLPLEDVNQEAEFILASGVARAFPGNALFSSVSCCPHVRPD